MLQHFVRLRQCLESRFRLRVIWIQIWMNRSRFSTKRSLYFFQGRVVRYPQNTVQVCFQMRLLGLLNAIQFATGLAKLFRLFGQACSNRSLFFQPLLGGKFSHFLGDFH